HRIHPGAHQRDVQTDSLAQSGGNTHILRQHFRFSRNQKHIVKGESFLDELFLPHLPFAPPGVCPGQTFLKVYQTAERASSGVEFSEKGERSDRRRRSPVGRMRTAGGGCDFLTRFRTMKKPEKEILSGFSQAHSSSSSAFWTRSTVATSSPSRWAISLTSTEALTGRELTSMI